MHRCLEIPELVHEICLRCDKHSLAMFACTARLFDIALDRLWSGYHLDMWRIDLTVFAECFPSEIRNDLLSFTSPVEPRHWDRFNFYSGRVRALYVNLTTIDSTVLTMFNLYAPPGGLLPNLRELALFGGAELIHARGFLTPKLSSLYINISAIPQPGLSTASLLSAIPMICADIVVLNLTLPMTMPHNSIIAPLVRNFRRLRELSIDFIPARCLPVITSLPNLTLLSFLCEEDYEFAPWTGKCDTLVDLQMGASTKHIIQFFDSLPKCPLEVISIWIINDRDAMRIAEIPQVVISKCQTRSLRRVDVVDELDLGWPRYVQNIPGYQLTPFLGFPNITSFRYIIRDALLLDDAFISSLARSWPNLDLLHLTSFEKPALGKFPIPTAKSLASLAKHCPKLCSICLQFDATSISLMASVDIGEGHKNKICNRSVRVLDFRHSPIQEPAPVAEYLHALFPNVTKMYIPSVDAGAWKRVRDTMLQTKDN